MEKDTLSDILKKPEKLASAVYLITSFFNDLEPLKWKLRDLSSELISISQVIKDNYRGSRNDTYAGLKSNISELRTQLSIAKNAGLVSETHYELIDGEFSRLLGSFEPPVLSHDFFKIPKTEEKIALPEPEPEAIKDKTSEPVKREYLPSLKSQEIDKGQKKTLREFGAVSVKKNSRQSVIISLLKRKKEIMIKDISPLISGCSEKTIQRELLAMVKAGILEKHGEKRWSRYTLANEAR